ncbi:MAG: hypothetical protein AABZ44_08155 [Elusimicrobiota bacterium]
MSLKSWVTWVVLAIALCACAGQRRFVTFERNELPAGFDATQKTALERVLIIVERKRSTQPTAAARGALEGAVRWLGKLSSAHVTADVQYASAELDADRLGEAIADEFIAAGHAVAAHLAADGSGIDVIDQQHRNDHIHRFIPHRNLVRVLHEVSTQLPPHP